MFLSEVEHWSAWARQAGCDQTYDITAEIAVPASLPPWVEAEPCPRAHLDAMMAAGRAMRGRVEAALDDLTKAKPPPGRADAPDRLFGMAAEANTAIDFAESLWSPEAGPELHERVEESLRRGIAAYYRLGQLLAAPMLLDRVAIAPAPTPPAPAGTVLAGTVLPGNGELALPGQPGFDPWCLTDPVNRSLWQCDKPPARRSTCCGGTTPTPPPPCASRRSSTPRWRPGSWWWPGPSGRRPTTFFRCPWSAIYFVYRPVVIAGQSLTPIQQFAFDVSVEPMLAEGGGEFARHLVFGPFHASSQVDYGDRASGE